MTRRTAPFRLSQGGRLIDRAQPRRFRFDGRGMDGFAGDTLASALLANGQLLMGRSFKYHRPRGPLASGVEEPNALLGVGEGARFEPNQRATTTPLVDGMVTVSQNAWGSLNRDWGVINDRLWRYFPAGFYYKTFIHPRAAWKRVFEPVIRRAAGLGRAPKLPDADRYEQAYAFAEVVVVGGGIAGLAAAHEAARTGGRVILLEQQPHWGGRSPVDHPDGTDLIEALLAELRALPNVTLRRNTMATGLYDHGYLLAREHLADHEPHAGIPRQRLWRIRAGQVVNAAGALERPLAFAGNDVPGVMLASAVRDYIADYGVAPGRRIAVVTNNDDAYRTALAALDAGLEVPVVIDARPAADGPLPRLLRDRGVRIAEGKGIASVQGKRGVEGLTLCAHQGAGEPLETIACDVIAMSGGWSPVVHLWSHCGGKLQWHEDQALFAPDPARPPVGADGQPNVRSAGAAEGDLRVAGLTDAGPEAPILPVWVMPENATPKARFKMWLDYQNDVKVSDVQLAALEGYASVEHAKRYTTLGMATDQGKISNINGLAILSSTLDQPIAATGTTTFRPPYTPLTLGTIAGEARGEVFQPLRRTPIHDWHEAHGAHWEPVGLWRRAYCYPRAGESHRDAVDREILAVRGGVGTLDASTLGKILVKGPDAGRFLDMIYTGMMSTLPVGKCRYGLMCSENGFLVDDGVAVRLSEDTWLCHTTTGGADRIHGHMEDWLQCEWWDWKVYTANITEQFAQVAVAGPKARMVLEKLGGMDLSAEALPFMSFAEGHLAGVPARIYRISFSGELSFEIAVPANRGLEIWEKLHEAGAEFGITPYGTEAMHVMRAEKGFIMIGDETDGTVIPQDLGMNWAISTKKHDYIGKRAQERRFMADPDRWRLVGLESLDGRVLPDGALAVAEGVNANGQRNTQGRVTSTYWSPTLKAPIAMGLVRHGPERMGEVLEFPVQKDTFRARIVDPVFHDKEGAAANV
ncbi:sarcosine oxidase subunit alpha family protein [Paracoccus sp. MC1862]|uniref:sarcosine oxidase subunit alpha family protein n=1 Tax=Paracoccus sp. MC1862 TaxID=2760307 RepID=UPI0015FFA16B|nr:sarcosine oxidase subunit alpha family protein [Paracoccus sp. MC1862]MBB1497398.1 sarcosine oxidase subunit alpha family protein [Paracoccus sp. MC1862]QQO45889.1 sarcosine oxidase subunit alpha family protein [Paracoccus sp. MC1862]